MNSQSAANQMIGTRTLHVAQLYWGADSPVSRIISLWLLSLVTPFRIYSVQVLQSYLSLKRSIDDPYMFADKKKKKREKNSQLAFYLNLYWTVTGPTGFLLCRQLK